MSEQYKPGDVVKGQILTQFGQWVPVRSLYAQDVAGSGAVPGRSVAGGPSTARKWVMGFVWIVLAGWLGMGTVCGLVVWRFGTLLFGGVPDVVLFAGGDLAGIGFGVWYFGNWLAKAGSRR